MKKTLNLIRGSSIPIVIGVVASFLTPERAQALPISLGEAGPGNFTVLETGNHASGANVSIANASNAGYITGNVGIASTGSVSDSGTPITGNVYVATGASANSNVAGNVTGSVFLNASLSQAQADALSAANAAAALASTSISDITTTTTLTGGGVFSLSNITLNSETLTLQGSATDYYVFNISGALTLNSSSILLSGGLTESNVLFNVLRVGGTGVGLSGGLANESVLHGIVLAENSSVTITPGLVVGEIISGDNISIASGAQVQGAPAVVPDDGNTALLIVGGLATMLIGLLRRK